MKVLIACEYSGIVRSAFERHGHYAMSADFEDTDLPGNHYKGDVFDIINDGWDLMVAHPPCTYLCKAQIHRLKDDELRKSKSIEAIEFVKKLLWSNIPRVAIENPVGLLSNSIKLHDQLIYPYQFGDPYRKDICLWLKNLPPLKIPPVSHWSTDRKSVSNHVNSRMTQSQKSKIKSRFFYHTADAMAIQWGKAWDNSGTILGETGVQLGTTG